MPEVPTSPTRPPVHGGAPPAAVAGAPRPACVRLSGALDRGTVAGVLRRLDATLADDAAGGDLRIDLSAVGAFDSAGIAGLVEAVARGRRRGREVTLEGAPARLADYLALLAIEPLTSPAAGAAPRAGPVRRLGAAVVPGLDGAAAFLRLFGCCLQRTFVAPLRGRFPRFDRTVLELDSAANGAVPITALIAFLLGLVLSMQAWVQLRAWSAELFVADMVGVSVITEIGPLMTAIVLAARSASANAAQLGAMVVGEEIDALRQMGVDPLRFLVVPKVVALTVASVALCALFDAVAICGAALFTWAFADIAPSVFQSQLKLAVQGSDLATAALKCAIFGYCVGVVGCAEGLRVRGGSVGVGRATTRAVVLGVFLVICVDALFVVLQRLVLA